MRTSYTFMSFKTTGEFRLNLVWRKGGGGVSTFNREDGNSTDIQNVDTFVPHKELHPVTQLTLHSLTPAS